MSWIDLMENHQFLAALFPEAPSLEAVRLHEVQLQQDGANLKLRFDLAEFPESPPEKWAECNVVQVSVLAVAVRNLGIRGWATDNVGTLSLSGTTHGAAIRFASGATSIEADADHLIVDSVTAYLDSSRP